MKIRKFAFVMLVILLVLPAYAEKKGYNDIFVFGDSLSDNGNAYIDWNGDLQPQFETNPFHYWNGRFSNGPVWTEYFADDLNARLHDYAHGSATTGTGGIFAEIYADVPGVVTQVNEYIENLDKIPPHSLFVLLAGANDLFGAASISNQTDLLNCISRMVNNMMYSIQALSDAGATDILVITCPDLGQTPYVLQWGDAAAAGATELTSTYNSFLMQAVNAFEDANPGIRIITADLFSIVKTISEDPAAYGLTTAYPFSTTCPNSEGEAGTNFDGAGFFFWDNMHPSTQGHGIVADLIEDVVKEEFAKTK